jgi:hypothetical protein
MMGCRSRQIGSGSLVIKRSLCTIDLCRDGRVEEGKVTYLA